MSKVIIKNILIFLILGILLFSLSGCYNIYNIDNLAYAVALGIDFGENNTLKLSFQLSIPGSDSGGGGSSQSDNAVVSTVECSSIDSGINLLNSYISKEVNLSHCKVIVFSEEFAYAGLYESIYTLMNNVQVRPDCNIIVSRCNADYFLRNSKPLLEKLSARYYEVATSSSDYTGYTESITLSKFFSDLNDTASQCYAILGGVHTGDTKNTNSTKNIMEKDSTNKANESLTDNKTNIENMGLAVFVGDKLVGELNGIECVCHQIIDNKLNISNITIASPFDEGETISLRVRLANRTKNKVYLTDNGPFVKTKVQLEARILTMDKDMQYLDSNNVEILEKYVNSYMSSQIRQYLYKISKEFNSDIDCFGKYAIKNFVTWDEWKNYDWLGNFKNSFFDVEVQTKVKSGYILMET